MAVEEDDLRTQLESAFKASREAEPEPITPEAPPDKPVEAKPDSERPRDERGRFVSGAEKPATGTEIVPNQPNVARTGIGATEPAPIKDKPAAEIPSISDADNAAAPAVPAPPNGWSADAKAKWHELPAEVQAAIDQREKDVAKLAGRFDEERAFGRDMYRAVQPYVAQIRAEGGTPASAVASLLNTAYVLRAGSPEQKQQALLGIAQQFNIALPTPQEGGEQVHPDIARLQQEIAGLRQTLTQSQTHALQQTQAEVQNELEAFASDPSHSHFHEVKAHMAALLKAGLASDLKDAYEQACYARPDIRATLTAQQRAAEEQKRRSEETARAQNARNKAISITGGPGSAAAPAPENRSLRDELVANFRAASGAV